MRITTITISLWIFCCCCTKLTTVSSNVAVEFILVFNEDDRNRKINLLFSGTENTIWMEGASKVEVVAVVWGWCEVGRGVGGG